MASLINNISVEKELRPCKVDGKNYLFHQWSDVSEIVAPSLTNGAHPGGVVRATLGIVEGEDGKIKTVYAGKIQFIDGKIKQYAFDLGD